MKDSDSDETQERPLWVDVVVFLGCSLVAVPVSCLLTALILAIPYTILTTYDFWQALQYLVSNMAGLSTPLTNKQPSPQARFPTIVLSTIGYILVAVNTGVIAQLPLTQRIQAMHNAQSKSNSLKSIVKSVLRAFGEATLLIIVNIALSAAILTAAERGHMSVAACFLYTFSNAVGLCDPLTEQYPETAHGRSFAVIGAFSNLGVLGAIVGVFSQLDALNDILVYLQVAAKKHHKDRIERDMDDLA